ncbi:HEAT repeat domain-containing protein [Phenylobacterium sp.]|uniref:HEAT repeat domain-containing protein n=1 Tax=Phenylobacterium sp. TaxID=1871053 RepID=UPI003983B5B7
MSLLSLIWSVALALCAAAVLWMSALIVLRVFSDRAARRRAEDRRAVERCFVGILQGRSDVVRDLAPYRGRARLMAESLLDFLTLVRGVDLEIVLGALESVGVDKVLAARLNRGSLAGRLASVEALGAFAGEATRAALVQAAARGPATVRLAALRSLLQAGGEVDIARLLQHLARGELRHSGPLTDLAHLVIAADPTAAMGVLAQPDLAPATRILIVEGLGAAGAYAALPIINAHAEAGRADVRAAAISTLGRMMHPAAEPALERALTDPAWEVRSAAAAAIGEARLASLVGPLAAQLSDSVWIVRFQSAGALLKLGESGLERLRAAALGADARAEQTASLMLAERGLA